MVRSRLFDQQMMDNLREGGMAATWHCGQGHEGANCAAVSQLRPDDFVCYTHRGCYVWLSKGLTMREIMAEFYGKETGCAHGKGGTHIINMSLGVFGRSGTQGGHMPLMTGAAWAAQLAGKGQVAMVWFGDGCACRGTFHESINHAAVYKLPIIYCCENNGFSMGVRTDRSWAVKDISVVAGGYGIPAVTVDGTDTIASAEAADAAISRARAGQGPSFIEFKVVRFLGHSGLEPQRYRTPEEIEDARRMDPLPKMRDALVGRGILTQADVDRINAAAAEEV
ncbi:MAG: thiamine pyrophosphate-dependent dehydrogenase E1 component subunit alpha, partial [Pseudomonadota bacterium]